ncbi:hypothetical protein TNCV_2881071 [Trichonephila clavipes]|nr:hypothetical protein TNCV_2881071 [Trichonephila clavipes]
MAFGGSLSQINLGVQGVTQGGHHKLVDGYSSRKRKKCPASFQAKKCVVPVGPVLSQESFYCPQRRMKSVDTQSVRRFRHFPSFPETSTPLKGL